MAVRESLICSDLESKEGRDKDTLYNQEIFACMQENSLFSPSLVSILYPHIDTNTIVNGDFSI